MTTVAVCTECREIFEPTHLTECSQCENRLCEDCEASICGTARECACTPHLCAPCRVDADKCKHCETKGCVLCLGAGCDICSRLDAHGVDLVCDDCQKRCDNCRKYTCPEHINKIIFVDRAGRKEKHWVCVRCSYEAMPNLSHATPKGTLSAAAVAAPFLDERTVQLVPIEPIRRF